MSKVLLTEKEQRMLECVCRASDERSEDIMGGSQIMRTCYARVVFALLLYHSGLCQQQIADKIGRHRSAVSVMLRDTKWKYDHDSLFSRIVDGIRTEYQVPLFGGAVRSGKVMAPEKVLSKIKSAEAA